MTLTTSEARPPSAEQPPIRVVFADDSAAIRTLARFALSARRGFDVVGEAADGAEALQLVKSHPTDCVILDVEMPGVGGFEALAQLQRSSPSLPVVMLSGFCNQAVTDRAMSGGAAAYLEKDSGFGLLAETVRRVTRAAEATALKPSTAEDAATAPIARTAETDTSDAAAEPVSPTPAAPDPATLALDTLGAEMRRLEYVVSHDFAEPARILNGFSTLLATRYGDELDDSGRAFLGHIKSAADRLQSMIDDLLVFSRAGRSDPVIGEIAVGDLVNEIFSGLARQIAESGAELTAGQLPTVFADRTMLTTVLRHLVANGLLFNTSDHPTVHITAVPVEAAVPAGSLSIEVTDNGIGISTAQSDDVFELFRRLNTREEYPGTGTGLALCRRLMSAQRGTIRLRSAPDQGTTVTLTLPAPHPQQGETS